MSQLDALRSAVNLHGVAALLDFTPMGLAYVLYKKDPATRYTKFEIPKRAGGTRLISAPAPDLKLIQRRLADLLQNCVIEINKATGQPDRISHGFKRERSIISNAREHRNRRYVFNLDLENFFGAINFGRVRGFFIKDKNFALHEDVATVIAQIACHENALPQGSPCSPVISNLVGHILDIHLVRLASKQGCSYTRYADDLTFSTNRKDFPKQIAQQSDTHPHTWHAGSSLGHLVEKSGFQINAKKVRMQYRDSRQQVTGLIVNRKVNIRSEYRHQVRAMVHRLFTKGAFDFVHAVEAAGVKTKVSTPGTTRQLHGMLGFIDSVDLFNESIRPPHLNRPVHHPQRTSKELMYRRFLLFNEFYAAPAPVLICEGKSDTVYLTHAIRSLAKDYPQLAEVKGDKIRRLFRIYRYTESSTGRILGISEGTSGLKNFMLTYWRETPQFKAPGKKNPVILLVDNDDGADPIYKTILQITKTPPKPTMQFIHVVGNLYVLPTPLPAGTSKSAIEDFFDAAIKNTKVEGKSFDPTEEKDVATHYGKTIFAHKVVKPNAKTIDFSAFKLIFDNLVALLDSHAKKFPASSLT